MDPFSYEKVKGKGRKWGLKNKILKLSFSVESTENICTFRKENKASRMTKKVL